MAQDLTFDLDESIVVHDPEPNNEPKGYDLKSLVYDDSIEQVDTIEVDSTHSKEIKGSAKQDLFKMDGPKQFILKPFGKLNNNSINSGLMNNFNT